MNATPVPRFAPVGLVPRAPVGLVPRAADMILGAGSSEFLSHLSSLPATSSEGRSSGLLAADGSTALIAGVASSSLNKAVIFAAVILVACILVEAFSTADLKAGLLDDHAGNKRLQGYATDAVKEPGEEWRDKLTSYYNSGVLRERQRILRESLEEWQLAEKATQKSMRKEQTRQEQDTHEES